ncbi:MAG: glycosyltransferase family 2 protein [Actinobacteria bacterium]|nr:MAG: glycosyltransferase family 2 protein [Actinomycetota bacterium]
MRAIARPLDTLVVDDGSHDATAAVAAKAGATVVSLPFNLGVGGAVRTGLRYAAEHGYDRAVVIDADGQHQASEIADLLGALDRDADVAVGSRFAVGAGEYRVSKTRRAAMRVLARIVQSLTGQRFTDPTSGFRAFGRPAIEVLARDYPVEYLADTVEVLLIVCSAGLTVAEVPSAMRVRAGGRPSQHTFRLLVNYLRVVVGLAGAAMFRPRRRRAIRRARSTRAAPDSGERPRSTPGVQYVEYEGRSP